MGNAKRGEFVWPAWRDRAERQAPTRARAVLAYIAIGERQRDHPPKRRTPRSRRERSIEARRDRYQQPDATERTVQDLNRRMRAELQQRPADHGAVSGPLAVAADYAAEHMLKSVGLGPEHRFALCEWITAKFGDVLRDPGIDGYLAWREDCLLRAELGDKR